MKVVTGILVCAYTVLLIYWMFIGFGRSSSHSSGYHYNVVPLHTIKLYVVHAGRFDLNYWLVNLVGNIAVFAPLGLTVPYICRLKLLKFTVVFVLALFLLESLQLLLQRGSFDIDDILLNTVGAWLGFACLHLIRKRVTA
ncbi:VanZ family protein [Paenibacillus sp. R14(2021)]|uniref:VanZ family protein n=1 Tax=Paenibacillus sp. R14(2021) TaxID=2859228 RepID=UPI001C611749|nr:VanZ family protein [Paenibacillus sp. R14(2021)]